MNGDYTICPGTFGSGSSIIMMKIIIRTVLRTTLKVPLKGSLLWYVAGLGTLGPPTPDPLFVTPISLVLGAIILAFVAPSKNHTFFFYTDRPIGWSDFLKFYTDKFPFFFYE